MDTWDRRWWWNPTVVHYTYSIWCRGFTLSWRNDNTLQSLLSGAWTSWQEICQDQMITVHQPHLCLPFISTFVVSKNQWQGERHWIYSLCLITLEKSVSWSHNLIWFSTMEYFTYSASSVLKKKNKVSLFQTKASRYWNCTRGKISAQVQITMSFPSTLQESVTALFEAKKQPIFLSFLRLSDLPCSIQKPQVKNLVGFVPDST